MVKIRSNSKREKIIIRIVALILCVSVIHTMFPHFVVYINAKKWIKYFENEDKEGLYNIFCTKIKDEYPKTTKKEIEEAFAFIDGDITLCEYQGEGGGRYSKDNYRTKLYSFYPHYKIETDTGKKYTIRFLYYYICKENPEFEGVCRIRIINYQGDDEYLGEEICIGRHPDDM